ncbi:ATP/GTP-binding protein [Rhodococcoides corynebacterioides]|uniref:ATP/GTP-binding protein n=1 Tax=Rhodococcoides corynebacterioides TaxID=53972 RepID=UPI00082A999C|nr:ATP/GTP-binding protein [Rhodococcus corynebacterioides]MBY6352008.1 ATP/GTP-binding protein [Rhodococcus corynebacterioides]MBY6364281.1 ATP/GTP-binding protein [Rhodococcus corynebacterioides]
MPRRHHRRSTRPDVSPTFGGATARTEAGPGDEDYAVRSIPGARAVKPYRCPGCDHEIAPGVPHLVVWPLDRPGGADDRRHWHTGCWSGRRTRGLTRRWS